MSEPRGNPFTAPHLAAVYEQWYDGIGRRASLLEKQLLGSLFDGFPGAQLVLDVGCGSGHFTRWLAVRGLVAIGADLSLPMLLSAHRHETRGLVGADACALPFADASFDLALIVTALEFVPDPEAVLREAARVARQGLVIGALNRRSTLGRRLARETEPPWSSARLMTVRELVRLATRAAPVARSSIRWRTTLWPVGACSLPLPWGDFIGLSIDWTGHAPRTRRSSWLT